QFSRRGVVTQIYPRFGISRKSEASDKRRCIIAVECKRCEYRSIAKPDRRADAVRFTLKPDRLTAIECRKAFHETRPERQRFIRGPRDRSKRKFRRCRVRKNSVEQRVHKSLIETDRKFLSLRSRRHRNEQNKNECRSFHRLYDADEPRTVRSKAKN